MQLEISSNGRSMTEEQLTQLTFLIEDFLDAKDDENFARQKRIEAEEKIATLVPGPEDGQVTIKIRNTKLTVKRGLIYKADLDGIAAQMVETEFFPPIKTKAVRELDVQGYEWYRANHPDIFSVLSNYVQVRPKKVSVTVNSARQKQT